MFFLGEVLDYETMPHVCLKVLSYEIDRNFGGEVTEGTSLLLCPTRFVKQGN
jgi:hypothetical protein